VLFEHPAKFSSTSEFYIIGPRGSIKPTPVPMSGRNYFFRNKNCRFYSRIQKISLPTAHHLVASGHSTPGFLRQFALCGLIYYKSVMIVIINIHAHYVTEMLFFAIKLCFCCLVSKLSTTDIEHKYS